MLDTGNNLVLSVETDRTINLNSSRYFLGVEGDKEVKIIRFQLDRYYCGIDLSVFKPRVNYKLSNSKEYYGEATMADFDDEYIYVEWTLDPSVTSVKGRVDFLVQLTKLDEDGSILKRYNSTMAIGRVEEGLNPEDQLSESMKKDILAIAEDTLTQLKESKIEFDNRLKIISDKQNEIIVRLNATDLKIDNFDNDYETKMNEFHTDYQEKMESFETDYLEKMKSAIKNIEDTSVQSVTNVENAKDEALQNIQNKSTEFLNNIDEAENKAIKNIENSGEHYQEQINTLQQESAQQGEVLDKLNEEVNLKVTQPYLNNKGENHVANSDNGALKNVIVEGNTVQNSTKGYQLFDKESLIVDSILEGDGTLTYKTNAGYHTTDFIEVTEGETYTITATSSQRFKYFKADKTPLQTTSFTDVAVESGGTFTIPQNIKYIRFTVKDDKKDTIMLNKGSTTLTFELYTGGQPSPNPDYPQGVKGVNKLTGKILTKNLFKYKKEDAIFKYVSDVTAGHIFDTSNGTSTSNIFLAYTDLKEIDNQNVYLTVNGSKSFRLTYIFTDENDVILTNYRYTGSTLTRKIPLTVPESTAKLYLNIFDVQPDDVTIQLELGNSSTDYEIYQEQLISYQLEKPLFRLSDSVYDYIDADKGKIIRNIGYKDFVGAENEKYITSNSYKGWYTNINDAKKGSSLLCSLYRQVPYVAYNQIGLSFTNDNNLKIVLGLDIYNEFLDDSINNYIKVHPFRVYYQLATPVEEPMPSDLQTLLQSLKSYYPQTNIMFDTEVKPYINFDYKLNLKSWIEDKDNKEIEYDKSVNDIQPYSDSYIEKWFNLMRTGRVYTVKFPLWETSQSPIGEKLDANRGLICEPSTPLYAGQNDYDDIPIFKTFDVNAYVDNDGEVHLTAFKGDENFQDTGKVDVFVLTMSYYEKTWTEDGYWYYSISDSPKPGYAIAKECLKKDGSIRPYALYAKYVAGAIDGQPYSSKGLIPCYYPYETISAYHLVSYCKQRGKYYTGGLMWDYKYIWTRFMLKFANTNSQAVLGGVFDYSMQYPITVAEENVKRVIVSKSNATRYVVGSCVSIGDWGEATSMDRSNKNCHNIARNVKILSIEDIDDSNSALNLDLAEPITTTTTCRVTTMHYLSGYSDEILGRDGSLGTDPKSIKHPIVISGIECAVGGYEIPCNAMMNILNASGDREVYITHDATKLSTNTQTIMNTWKKSGMTIKTSKVSAWQYITKMGIDTELGCVLPLAAGESGSGSSTGFGDGLYTDGAASGQREFLLLGLSRGWFSRWAFLPEC